MHKFGGKHTELKVDVLKRYLEAYLTVMKNQQFFTLWYIDAFAGSGSRVEVQPATDDLFGPVPATTKIFAGSANVALNLEKKFHRYRFVESHRGRRKELEKLVSGFTDIDAKCLPGDANVEIVQLLAGPEWIGKANHRGVIFLDPYGLSVDHATIKAIARTEKLDVWYLFSLEGIYRQAAHDPTKIDLKKDDRLSKIFGRDDWRELFYQRELVDDLIEGKREVVYRISYKDMPGVIKGELEKVFASVCEPLPLPRHTNPPQFLLYFCVSNPAEAAITPARRIANHIIGN